MRRSICETYHQQLTVSEALSDDRYAFIIGFFRRFSNAALLILGSIFLLQWFHLFTTAAKNDSTLVLASNISRNVGGVLKGGQPLGRGRHA